MKKIVNVFWQPGPKCVVGVYVMETESGEKSIWDCLVSD